MAQVIPACERGEKEEPGGERVEMTVQRAESFVLKGGGELEPQPEQGDAGEGGPSEKTQEGPSAEIHACLAMCWSLPAFEEGCEHLDHIWSFLQRVNDFSAVVTTCSASLCPQS